jgi:hypothetical protein
MRGTGLTNALGAIVLLLANRPSVCFWGTLLYLLSTGFCNARYVALMLDIVGTESRDTSTWYAALTAVGNVPIASMIWLEGKVSIASEVWTAVDRGGQPRRIWDRRARVCHSGFRHSGIPDLAGFKMSRVHDHSPVVKIKGNGVQQERNGTVTPLLSGLGVLTASQ